MVINLYEILQQVLNESVEPDKVRNAISNKNRVIISYSDEKNRAPNPRYIEPYVLGRTKAGNPCFRAYQYEGDTFRGIPKWKLFRLDRVTDWKDTNDHFNVTPRENGWNAEEYNRNGDKSMSQIDAMVTFDDNNPEGLYSPSNTLYNARLKTQRMQQSNSVNVNDIVQNSPVNITNTNDSGPVQNDTNSSTPSTDSSNPRGAVDNIATAQLGGKEKSYWDDFDKAEQEMNQQTAKDRYNTNKREKRWQNAVDTQRKWRKGAMNDF